MSEPARDDWEPDYEHRSLPSLDDFTCFRGLRGVRKAREALRQALEENERAQ
jgi:hypothetical protein